jgi:hypothetical protein
MLLLLLLQLINWRERIGCLCAWIFWWLRCLLRGVYVCVCVCVWPTHLLLLLATVCLLALCVADGYKTHKNKTMTIHVKDWVAWWIVITQCLNEFSQFVCSLQQLPHHIFFGFFFCFWSFRMPSSSKPIHWKDMTISHSSSKSDLGFVLLCITSDHWLTQGQNINRF